MESTEYRSKINELVNIKERKKLLRQIQESKKRLFYGNPEVIVPFMRDKVSDSLLRNSYPSIRQHSPVVREPITNVNTSSKMPDNIEYLALMREQRSLIEQELQMLRLTEENNRKDLERRLEEVIVSQSASNNASVAEIRTMLKTFHEAQSDLQKESQSTNPNVRELKLLKTNYILDGGHDPQLLAEMDHVIQEADGKKNNQISDNNAWMRRRKDLAIAREKSYELRDLERQNAELERQLDLAQVRNGIQSERNMKTNEKKVDNEKMEILQKQIEQLQTEIFNLKQPPSVGEAPKPIETSSIPIISTREPAITEKRNIVILIDFISGLGQHIQSIGLILSIFHGQDQIRDSLMTEPIPIRQRDPSDLDSSALVNIKHPVISCPALAAVYALVELQVKTESNSELRVEGWAKLNLFNDRGELKVGKWNEFILRSPVLRKATSDELFRLPRYHRSVLHYRLALYSSDEVLPTGLTSRNYEPSNDYAKSNPFMVNNDARNIDVDHDDAKSDVTMDLDERPEFGFQMIRVKNMSSSNGLELAKVRLTVYHTEGPKKGHIVMGTEGPVTCATSAVSADFKIANYNFGRQLASFTNVDLTADCIVFARFYFEGNTGATVGGAVNERLVAWTALPAVKRRTAARHNPSFTTDSLKLLRINRGLHDLCLYEPPALPPTAVFFDKKGFIVGQKVIGRSKLKFRVFHTKIVYDSATSSDNTSMDEGERQNFNTNQPWKPTICADPPLLPYLRDEGFDLYLDCGRLFPDSTTMVKIEGSIVDRNLNSQGPQFSAVTALSSDIFNPVFNQRIEVREPYLTPSSTLLLKVMTFDREDKNLVILGYAALKLFIETGSGRQPNFDNLGVLVSLNEGGHQIRIFSTELTVAAAPFTEDWFMRKKIQSIPGASLLIRIYKSPKNIDGKSININEVPKNYQARLGIIVPAPAYEDGYYHSSNCQPTEGEHKIMLRHCMRTKLLLKDLLASKWTERLQGAESMRELSDASNILRLFDMFTKNVFNFNHVAYYVPTNGFKISIDGALNLPWSGYPMGHLCLYPPGALYMKRPLMAYDRPYFISKLDFFSSQTLPIWTNGWKTYRRRKYSRNLVAILHLHEMKIKIVKNDFVFTLESQAWTPIQIFDGPYCLTRSVQMPLISGSPTLSDIQELDTKSVQQFLLDNIASKKIVPLQLSSVVIRQCDSRRHLEIAVSADTEQLTLDQSCLPQESLVGYRNILSHNLDVQFNTTVPVGFSIETFQEFIRVKFKSLIYKLYEQDGLFLQ